MWLDSTFDEPPPKSVVEEICKDINEIYIPKITPSSINFLDGSNNFHYSPPIAYPSILSEILSSGHEFTSGWIPEIKRFWAASSQKLVLFSSDLSYLTSVSTISSAVTVGYISPVIIVSHTNCLSIFSYPSLNPIKNRYILASGLTVTSINNDIAGCNDSTLRRISYNPHTHLISVSGLSLNKSTDPIVTLVRSKSFSSSHSTFSPFSRNYIAALTTNGHIFLSSTQHLSPIPIPLENVVSIIDATRFNGKTTEVRFILITRSSSAYILTPKGELTSIGTFINRRETSRALWSRGVLIAVDSARPSMDFITIASFSPFPISISLKGFGIVYALGETHSSSINQVFHIMTSVGIINASTTQYNSSDQIIGDFDPEEVWQFCTVIAPVFDMQVDRLIIGNDFSECIGKLYEEGGGMCSALAKFISLILQDISTLRKSPIPFVAQTFNDSKLSDFFSGDKYSHLRKIAFETNLQSEDVDTYMVREVRRLQKGGYGEDYKVEVDNLVAEIMAVQTAPPGFLQLLDFMLEQSRFSEIIECVIKWGDSVMKDEKALSYLDANCPQSPDDTSSFYVRSRIYQGMIPLLDRAAQNPSGRAADVVRDELKVRGTLFARFVMEYYENFPKEIVMQFKFKNMLEILKQNNSRHLADALLEFGFPAEAFHQHIENCHTLSQNDVQTSHQNLIENTIIELSKATNERIRENVEEAEFLKAERMLKCAILFQEFEIPDAPRLVCLNSYEIIEELKQIGELRPAMAVADIYGDKRTDLLEDFVRVEDEEEIRTAVRRAKDEISIFSEVDIAQVVFKLSDTNQMAIDACTRFGIGEGAIFQQLNQSNKEDSPPKGELVANLLENWENVDENLKEKVADIMTDQILLETQNGHEDKVKDMRFNLRKCFLKQNFSDEWDI